jgi:hypothetical protein
VAKVKENTDAGDASADTPEIDDGFDTEDEPLVDAQLDEVIHVLRDYNQMLQREHKSAVVLKKD